MMNFEIQLLSICIFQKKLLYRYIAFAYIEEFVSKFKLDLLLWWKLRGALKFALSSIQQRVFSTQMNFTMYLLTRTHIQITHKKFLELAVLQWCYYSFVHNCTQCSSFTGITWTHKIHEPWVVLGHVIRSNTQT